MRHLFAAILLASALSCKDTTAPEHTGFVRFRLDANSCGPVFGSQTLNFTFFVDGTQVGATSLGVTSTSPSYEVSIGSHLASARVTNTTVQFENLNAIVSEGQTFTYILSCN